MNSPTSIRSTRKLAILLSALAIAGCGQGDGPESIQNTPATPLPPIPAGFCDPINFEILCTPPTIVNFNGGATTIIDNPDPTGINTSDSVAQMQKFPDEVFGGTRLDLDAPVDFSNGEFYTIKVWSSRAVDVSFKLEETGNPGGGVTLAATHSGSGTWEELCYNFTGSPATIPTPVEALTIIFDLGTLGAADTDPDNWTFFYDDITQVATCGGGGGGSSGPTSVDFEDAGGPYTFNDFGGGVASVIDNPDMSGINTSAKTAQMQKFAGEVFGGSTLSLGSDIDFGEGEVFTVKVWASRQVPVLFKFEELNKERSIDHSGSGTWEELCFDFTADTTGAASNAITFIFDLGTAGDAANNPNDWTFYFDDIEQVASCPTGGGGGGSAASIDFEAAGGPYAFNDFGGGASTVVTNPDMSGINTSTDVVQMQKFAGEIFGGSTFDLASAVDFGEGEVFTMKVWSPRLVPVLFKLEGLNQERSQDHSGGSMWQELCFDFTGSTAGAPATGITVIFDLGTNGDAANDPANWTFYYDDIQQTDACPGGGSGTGVLPVDFEGDPNNFVFRDGGGFGGGQASVVSNPDMTGNSSAQVGQMLKFDGEVFGGATLDFGGTVDVPPDSAFTMNVWSQRPVPVLFKLEGGPVGEVSVNHGGTGWEQLCFDFTGVSGSGVDGITLIFDLGVNGAAATDPANWTFYFDDIDQADDCGGGGTGNTETVATDFESGNDVFRDGGGFGGGQASVVANPDMNGNASANVGQMQKFTGEVFGGATLDLGGTLSIPAGSSFTMLTWSQRPVPVLFKLEGGPVAEISVNHGGTGWELLTFDFSGVSGDIDGITLIFDLGVNGDAGNDPTNWTFYFDDITLVSPTGGGSGGGGSGMLTNGDFETGDLTDFEVFVASGGSVTASNAENNTQGGSWSANAVSNGAFASSVLKVSFLLAGDVQNGDTVNVAFDMKGSAADGGVINPKLIAEGAGGAATGFELDTIAAPTVDWTTYSYMPVVNADVSQGVSFEIAVVCGGAASCSANVFIDNISISVQ